MDAPSSAKNIEGRAQHRNAPDQEEHKRYFVTKVHTDVRKKSGLMHWMVITAANAYDLTPAAGLPLGDEKVVYGGAGCQGSATHPMMASSAKE